MVYGVILIIVFMAGPLIGSVEFELVYNMTCPDGHVQWFNESTHVVCGGENPLLLEQVNYLDPLSLT